jgi:CRP-like cAMP-binding protein
MSIPPQYISLKSVIERLVAPPADQWPGFQALFQTRSLGKGEFFIRAGQPSGSLAFINAGLLRFFYETGDGKEFNKSFSRENDFAGAYSAYLTRSPSRFGIQALENSHLLVAKFDAIVGLFDRHACWQRLGRLLAEQLYIRKEQREAEFLLDDALTRYRNFQAQYPGLESRVTQYHVASYLGITPVALSRIRKKSSPGEINPG